MIRTGNLPRLWLLSHRTSRARLTELLDGCRAECKRLAAQVDTLERAAESERQWRLRSLPDLLAAKARVEALRADLVAMANRAENAEATCARLRGYAELIRAREAAPATGEGRP